VSAGRDKPHEYGQRYTFVCVFLRFVWAGLTVSLVYSEGMRHLEASSSSSIERSRDGDTKGEGVHVEENS
jgi:hypothetical protein